MKSIRSIRRLFLVPVFAFTAPLVAQDAQLPCDELEKKVAQQTPMNTVNRITAFEPAEVIERVSPRYPEEAARSGAEGWVQMSYVIDAEGKVQDPVVEDFGGYKGFKRAALRAIKDWRFDPAIKNGKPTEQCHQSVQFDFTIGGTKGADRRFVIKYKKASDLIEQQDYPAAEKLIQEMHANEKKNNSYEHAWMWRVDSVLAQKLGDSERELHSIRRTLASSYSQNEKSRTLDEAYIGYLYQRLFSLEVNAALYAAAMKTHSKLEALPNSKALISPLQSTFEQVNRFLASDANFSVNAGLDEEEQYFHLLARHNFAFANIKGQLDSVEVRCESKREKFTVAEEYIWSIPESWGQCQVMVKGKKDTTFDLVEVGKA